MSDTTTARTSKEPPWGAELKRYNEALATYETERLLNTAPRSLDGYGKAVSVAAMSLTMKGLEAWIDTAEKDRRSQAWNRWAIVVLTLAIAGATVWSAIKPVAPVILPAPVVNIAAPPAPVVNIAPIPVKLTAPGTTDRTHRSLAK